MRGRLSAAVGLVLIAGLGADPRFRADDGNLWRLDDNPALAAVAGDGFSLGYAFTPDAHFRRGTSDLEVVSPLISFRYAWDGADTVLKAGAAMGPWEGLSLGYRADQVTAGGVETKEHNFGVLYRPFDSLSAAVTVDDAFRTDRVWGAGLGLRPLTIAAPGADWLTLTADARWNGTEVEWERWGGRLSWQGSDLRVWFDARTGAPGAEATLTWGASETTLSNTRVGSALRWTSRTPDTAVLGPTVLRIRGTGSLAAAPVPRNTPAFLPLPAPGWDLPALTALLNQASRSPVAAVVLMDPPRVEGLAGAQTLAQALAQLKRAGKKIYVYADSYDDSLGFQGWLAGADRVVLDPNGSVALASSGSRRLYLKGLLDSVGVRFINYAPWETKSANNTLTFAAMPEAERAMVTRYLRSQDDQASAALASGRGERLKARAGDLVAQGPYLVAQEALDAGLVDALENRSDFEAWLAEAQPGTVVDSLPQERSQSWGPPVTRRNVALVHLSGDVVVGPGQAGRSIGQDAVQTIEALRNDASVQAVVLRVNSPGGAVLPSDALADQVRKTVASGKPVLVLMGDVAASGGYYLAAPATRIWARPGTITGSIGVTAAVFTAPEALGKLGIQADGVDLGPSAAFGDWTRAPSPAETRKWEAMIGAAYQRFLAVVSEGRKIDKDKLDTLARGQVYTGQEAVELGLVDALGGQEDAEQWLEKELGGPVAWQEYLPGESDPFGGLLGPLAQTALAWADSPTLRLASALDHWAGPASEALTSAAARGAGLQVWFDAP